MKKLFSLVLAVAMTLLLTACSAANGLAQTVVELPSPIQLAILAGVTFVVGLVFAQIGEAVPWLKNFLGQYVDEVSVAIAGALTLTIQNLLNAIPPAWEGVANAGLALVVAILAAYGLLLGARKAALLIAVRKLTG